MIRFLATNTSSQINGKEERGNHFVIIERAIAIGLELPRSWLCTRACAMERDVRVCRLCSVFNMVFAAINVKLWKVGDFEERLP